MTEYDKKLKKEQITSEFIVGTCQLLPKSYDAVYEAVHFLKGWYAIKCGSTAEFYIRPLHSGINDTDELIVKGSELAFTEDFPLLPIDVSRLHDTIRCFSIEPYHRYPGFVRLRFLGELNYSWTNKAYEFSNTTVPNMYEYVEFNKAAIVTARHLPLKIFSEQPYTVRGPAVTSQGHPEHPSHDSVKSVWCPQWPKEAHSWSERPRGHGWPTINTISEVVQHGCHAVYVQHRDCRNEKFQWRLSFSIAEVILLQSWTQIQQIIYHMLRFFSERKLMQKDCPKEDEILCSYHLKTLMLWTCEEMSPEWWNSSSVIAICGKLLKKLSEWLERGCCPNYFIPDANLFREPFQSTIHDKIERQLNKFCKSDILCQWFVENYIHPFNGTHFEVLDLEKCLLSLTESRKALLSESLEYLFRDDFMKFNIHARISGSSQTIQPRSILSVMRVLTNFRLLRDIKMSKLPMPVSVSCFACFGKTLYSLNTAYSLGYGEISLDCEIFEYVKGLFLKSKIVRCKYHIFPEPFTAQRRQLQFLQAQDLMESLTGSNSPSEFQLLSIISKEFLRQTLGCDESESKNIAPAALVYLAALHFAASEHQIVMDLCSAVLMDQTTHIENETLNAGCLFFIDDVVRIVGFCLLCKRLNEKKQFAWRHIYLDLRLTAKVLAYYLMTTSHQRMSEQFGLNPELPSSAFPLDHFILAFAKNKPSSLTKSGSCLKTSKHCVYRSMDSVITKATLSVDPLTATEKIIDCLTEYALENMASFYSVIRKDFGIQCNTADCYRALYLYKCRQYDEMLHLCERILQEPDLQSDLSEYAYANVLVLPPFDSFFDRDVQSLVGFHTLFYFLSPVNNELRKCTTAAQLFDRHAQRSPLMIHYSVTSLHFLGRHFLARYLKLRCYFECSYPYRKALAKFAATKSNHPFEHIIRRFLLRQHCKVHQ